MALVNRVKAMFARRAAARVGVVAAWFPAPHRMTAALAPSLLFGHAFAISLLDASYGLELAIFACTVLAGIYALCHWGIRVELPVAGRMAALGVVALALEMALRRSGAVEHLVWMHGAIGATCGIAALGEMGAAVASRCPSPQAPPVRLLPCLCALCGPLLVFSAAQRVSATLAFRVGSGPFGPTFPIVERIVIGLAAWSCAVGALRALRALGPTAGTVRRRGPWAAIVPWAWFAAGACSALGIDIVFSGISIALLLLMPLEIARAVRGGRLAGIDAARGLVALAASSIVFWGGQFDSSVLLSRGVSLVFLMAALAGAGALGVARCLRARRARAGDGSSVPGVSFAAATEGAASAASVGLPSCLSPREAEVAELLLGGATQTAIADELGLSRGTIATYCRRVYDKTGSAGRAEFLRRCASIAHADPAGAGAPSCPVGISGRNGLIGGTGADSATSSDAGAASDGRSTVPDDAKPALGGGSAESGCLLAGARPAPAASAGAGRFVSALFSSISLVADVALLMLAIVPGLAPMDSPAGCSAASRMVSLTCAGLGLCVAGFGAMASCPDVASPASSRGRQWAAGPVGAAVCALLGAVALRRGLPGAFCEQAGLLLVACYAATAGLRVALRLSLLQERGAPLSGKVAAVSLAPWCAIAAGHVLATGSATSASALAVGAVALFGAGASWIADALGTVDGTRAAVPGIGYALTPAVAVAMVLGGCALACARIGSSPSMWAAPWVALPALLVLVEGAVLRGAGEGISWVRALSACVGWMTAGMLLGCAFAVPLSPLPAAVLLGACLAGYARHLIELEKRSAAAALGPAELIRAACAESGLTEAESEVVALLAAGFTVDECARRRVVGRSTIASQRRSAYAKLGVRTRVELRRHVDARIAAHLGAYRIASNWGQALI